MTRKNSLDEFLKNFDELKLRVTKLEEDNSNMRTELVDLRLLSRTQGLLIESLVKEHRDLRSKAAESVVNSNDLGVNKIIEVVREYEINKEKEKNVVIIGVPEEENDELTAVKDRKISTDLAVEVGIPPQSIECFRYGRKGNKPRILKVRLASKNEALKILRFDRKNKVLPNGSFIRRDMSRQELDEERTLRAECYKKNEENRLFKFIVRNGQIIELQNPRPWLPKSGSANGNK